MPEPNQVDEVYAYESDSASIIEQNQQNQAAQKNKYQTWNGTESDWGTYAGTEQNIYYNNYNTWGWNPYGYYSPYYGWGNGWNIGIGFSWNNWGWNNWGWNPYWDPYFGYGGYGYIILGMDIILLIMEVTTDIILTIMEVITIQEIIIREVEPMLLPEEMVSKILITEVLTIE